MLVFKDLTVKVGGRELLSRVSGEVISGKVRALVAPNGSGKTTLMKALIASDGIGISGGVSADGVPIAEAASYRKLVFYVPGDASILYPLLTVRENLEMVKRCWGSSEKIERLAERCRIDSFLNKRVRFLSLGMRQQVALTAAYLTGRALSAPRRAHERARSDKLGSEFGDRPHPVCQRHGRAHVLAYLGER